MARPNVLLDLDGTLTDSAPGIINSIRYALGRLEFAETETIDLRWCLGPPIHDSFARILNTSDGELVNRAIAFYRERFSTVGWLENSLYSGVAASLEALMAQGLRLFVATSKPGIYSRDIVDHFGIGRYFQAVYGSELDGTRSNKAELIAHLLEVEALSSDSCVMIGDRMHDVIGAQRNNIPCIGVTYGYGSPEELTQAGARELCDCPEGWLRSLSGIEA